VLYNKFVLKAYQTLTSALKAKQNKAKQNKNKKIEGFGTCFKKLEWSSRNILDVEPQNNIFNELLLKIIFLILIYVEFQLVQMIFCMTGIHIMIKNMIFK
jgi:hypothetical protein